MKGPTHRIKHNVRRQWKCPRCGMSVRTGGHVSSHLCDCDKNDPAFMKLVDLPTLPIVIPDPGEEPQAPAELLLTTANLTQTSGGELPELPRTLTMHDTLSEEIAARVASENEASKTADAPANTPKKNTSADSSATQPATDASSETSEDGTDKPAKKKRRRRRNRRKKKS